MAAILRLVSDTTRATADAFDPVWLGMLRHLARSGPVHQSELCDALDLSPSAMDRQVRTLVDENLALVVRSGEDRTRWVVSITQAGREELAQIDEIVADFLGAVIERWTPEEVGTLTGLLTRLLDDWARFKRSADDRVRGAEP